MPSKPPRADIWTWLSVAKELLSGCTNVFLATAAVIDSCFDLKDDTGFGISMKALPWATAIAGLIALCSTYAHFNLNRLNQGEEQGDEELRDEATMPLLLGRGSLSERRLTFCRSFLRFFYDPRLTRMQNLVLFGDFLEHACEIFGPINFFVSSGVSKMNTLSHLQRILSSLSMQLPGLFFAVPDRRVCKEHFLKANAEDMADDEASLYNTNILTSS